MEAYQTKAVSVEQAAQMLSVGRQMAYELVRKKRLRSVRAGKRLLIPIAAIDEFLGEMPRPTSA